MEFILAQKINPCLYRQGLIFLGRRLFIVHAVGRTVAAAGSPTGRTALVTTLSPALLV